MLAIIPRVADMALPSRAANFFVRDKKRVSDREESRKHRAHVSLVCVERLLPDRNDEMEAIHPHMNAVLILGVDPSPL